MNLLICRSGGRASQVIRELGLGDNWKGVSLFSAFLGERFDRVVLGDCFKFASEIETEQAERLIKEQVPLLVKRFGVLERCLPESLSVTLDK